MGLSRRFAATAKGRILSSVACWRKTEQCACVVAAPASSEPGEPVNSEVEVYFALETSSRIESSSSFRNSAQLELNSES